MNGKPDAVVVGSGPNGLAAALRLAAAGLRVQVFEQADRPGGGMRTEELTRPGYRHDVCSTVQPMAAAAPFFREFDLPSRGVRLVQPEVCYAHPLDGGRAAVSRRSLEETADGLGPDAAAYRRLFEPLVEHGTDVIDFFLTSQLRRPPTKSVPQIAALRPQRTAERALAGPPVLRHDRGRRRSSPGPRPTACSTWPGRSPRASGCCSACSPTTSAGRWSRAARRRWPTRW